jgi:hypothetical protein
MRLCWTPIRSSKIPADSFSSLYAPQLRRGSFVLALASRLHQFWSLRKE